MHDEGIDVGAPLTEVPLSLPPVNEIERNAFALEKWSAVRQPTTRRRCTSRSAVACDIPM